MDVSAKLRDTDLFRALTGPAPSFPSSAEEVERIREAERKRCCSVFGRVRRAFDAIGAKTAAETGDKRQVEAMVRMLAALQEGERTWLDAINSPEFAKPVIEEWKRAEREIARAEAAMAAGEPIPARVLHAPRQPDHLGVESPEVGSLVWLEKASDAELEQWVRKRLVDESNAAAVDPEDPPKGTARHGQTSLEEANEIVMKLAKKDASFVNGGVREWAAAIREATGNTCSVDTVMATRLWQETMKTTGRGRKRGKTPKAVALTDNTEAVVGEGGKHEILNNLIAQQEADYEPSPLDDPPDTHRKVKHFRRV